MKGIAMKQRNDPVQAAALTSSGWSGFAQDHWRAVSLRSMIASLDNGVNLPAMRSRSMADALIAATASPFMARSPL